MRCTTRARAGVQFWHAAGKFAPELMARQRFAPTLTELASHRTHRESSKERDDLRNERFLALWQPLLDELRDAARVTHLANAMPPLCRAYALRAGDTPPKHSTSALVENRLSELWNIFQFLNPGYLGAQAEFQRRFANPIERGGDDAAAKQLKRLTNTFILRRAKTDPKVISDLPAKNVMKIFCNLTREQATLYEAVVRDSMQRIEQAKGMERRGIVLATLLKLKQVCNHPAQFLGDGSPLSGRIGKLVHLAEMLGEARAVRERALVFTQFAEMGKLLQAYLQAKFGDEVLFLYGDTPTKTRARK